MSLEPGIRLGRYEIRSQLGAGGMGEVYLVEDTLLRRLAAIKVLTGDYALNEERLHRFEREAYAASSLNHPNIVTIYEFGSEAGLHFIATEYVEGESLRQQIRSAQMDLRQVVDISIQVASALAAAHQTGIVHRDIKPENIMLRRDGYVKVLDFGLAKLALEVEAAADTEASTQMLLKTEPGRVIGTINYMSPEQARGHEVDARTDIFSLGIVLYEMVTGRRPFAGDTKSDVLAAVLMVEPPPLTTKFPELPAELNRIVGKALRKDREERYQSTKELLVDLKSLRHELEFEAKAGRPILRVPAVQQRVMTSGGLARQVSTARQPETFPTISELFINEVKSHPRRATVTVSILLILIAAAGVGLYRLIRLAQRPESFQSMRLTKATSAGNVAGGQAAISPDGKYLVYVVEEGGQRSLLLRQVATSTDVQLVAPRQVDYHGVTFSPDGNYVYYVVVETKELGLLYQIATLGGAPRKLIENADGPVTLSPDGGRVAFLRENRLLMVANSDGTALQTLATATTGKVYGFPAWSPDGRIIVCVLHSSADNSRRLVEINVKDGSEKALASPGWLSLYGITWVPDGSGLLLAARALETKLLQIWLLSYPDGKLRRITNDLSSYLGVSVTADGKTLASVQAELLSNIWTIPTGNISAARRLTFGRDDGYIGLASTSDGRIVYSSRTSGRWDLWIVNEDGTNNRQLTFNARDNLTLSVTADSRYVVFVSNRSGKNELWRMELDGGNPKQLTDSHGNVSLPNCSSDGKWVVYHIVGERKATIWRVSIEGGVPVQLTTEESGTPIVSPDGKFVACHYGEARSDAPIKLAIVSIEGGPPLRIVDLPLVLKSPVYRWTADGRGFVYIDSVSRVYNLWSQSLDIGPPKQLTDFGSDQIFRFDLTQDGKKIALSRGREGSDVVLITNFN